MQLPQTFVDRFGIDLSSAEPGRLGSTYRAKDPQSGRALAVKVARVRSCSSACAPWSD